LKIEMQEERPEDFALEGFPSLQSAKHGFDEVLLLGIQGFCPSTPSSGEL
jgi:hypothetical protein